MSFENRVAVITGAAGGLGSAVSRILADKGCRLVLVDIAAEGINQITKEVSEVAPAVGVIADVSKEEDVKRIFETAVAEYGTVDLLHNNAAILGPLKKIMDYPTDAFDALMAVNTRGVFLVLREFVRTLIGQEKGGAAVNTASVLGIRGGASQSVYAMSKHAVVGLTCSTAAELGHHGIRINAVCPGRIDTPMVATLGEIGDQEKILTQRPIPRAATPQEIANAVVWLLSDEASFVTGSVYTVDGGLSASV